MDGILGADYSQDVLLALFLAIVPGTLGHSGFFVAMRHLSSLTVTFALSFEPIIGSTIGYFMNVSSIPGFRDISGRIHALSYLVAT